MKIPLALRQKNGQRAKKLSSAREYPSRIPIISPLRKLIEQRSARKAKVREEEEKEARRREEFDCGFEKILSDVREERSQEVKFNRSIPKTYSQSAEEALGKYQVPLSLEQKRDILFPKRDREYDNQNGNGTVFEDPKNKHEHEQSDNKPVIKITKKRHVKLLKRK